MKITFFDVDGVVATHDSLYEELAMYFDVNIKEIEDGTPRELCDKTGLDYPSVSCSHWPFSRNAIKLIYKLQKETNCKFVMCSSWRLGLDVDEINDLMSNKGLRIRFIDKTTNWSKSGTRGEEIKLWLDNFKNLYPDDEIEQYVIIDDECGHDIIKWHPNNCVQPKFKTGFTEENLNQVIKILNQ